jgi:hypothetical protein
MLRLISFGAGLLAAVTLVLVPAQAQEITGAINGVIRDNSGAVLPQAVVSATNIDTGLDVRTTSDDTGLYTFALLRPGRYRLAVEKPGFQRLIRENVVVNTAERLRLDMMMEVGQVSESVTVVAQAPLLQSEQATLGHVVEGRTITSIPLATRNFTQILGTSAGVVGSIMNADNRGTGSDSVSVNGARRGSNNLLVDGVPTTNQLNNAPDGDGTPSIEFLSEFKVLTSLYSAEYGRNLGSVINVTTRSGANELHGSVYEFVRNTKFNARPFFFGQRQPNLQNQFGGNVGGKLIRDRTFFFGGWESSRQRNANGGGARLLTRVPTPAQRSGVFTRTLYDPLSGALFPGNTIPATRINGTSKTIMEQLIPLPNFSDAGSNNFQAFRAEPTDLDQYTVRIDHRFSDKMTLNGRWFESFQEDLAPFGRGLPGMGNLSNREKHTWGVALTRMYSPTFVMEFRASGDYTDQYTAGESKVDPASLGLKPISGVTYAGPEAGPPRIQIQNYIGGSFGNFENWSDYIDRYAGGPTFTWSRSKHVVKFGYEHHASFLNPQNNLAMRGNWVYSNVGTGRNGAQGDEFADFLLTLPQTKLFGGSDVPNIGGQLKMRSHYHSAFYNDDWKVTQNFMLSVGVRYEADQQAAAYNVNMVNFWPERYRGIDGTLESTGIVQGGVNGVPASTIRGDWNNLQPRIGLAWRVTDKWVIRAGSGLYFDLRTGQVAQSMFGNPPVYTRIDANCQRNVLCTLDQPDNWTYLDPGHKTGAVAFPLSPTEERAIQNVSPNTKTDNALQYNFAIQRELPMNMLVEMAYIGTKGTHLNGGENINPLIPVAGRDAQLFNGVQLRRTYPGFGDMTVITQRGSSTYHSFQSTLKQRLNSSTFQLAYTFGKTLGDGDDSARYRVNTFASTPWNQYSRAKGPVAFDRTHRVSFVFNHDLPNRFQSGIAKHALNNWSINGFLVAQTGLPLTVTHRDSGRNIGGGLTSTTATNLFANVISGVPLKNSGSAKDNLNAYMNLAAWAAPAIGTFGDSGRGMFRGPGQWNLDFSTFKDFTVTERWRLQFRSEFFNLFNHANPGNPTTALENPAFGTIRSTTVNARLIQFALKLAF